MEYRLCWPLDVAFCEDDYRLEQEQALFTWSFL